MCRPTNQYAAVITGVDRRRRRLPDGFDDLGNPAKAVSCRAASPGGGHGLLKAVEPYPCEGQRQRSRQTPAIRARFSRYSSPTGPVMASRQERQLVQSWLDLDDFLRAPWKGARS